MNEKYKTYDDKEVFWIFKEYSMVRLDTRGQLTGFFRLSQNDFEIDSRSVAATEREAYATRRLADTDTDGKITYSEYLDHLNRVTPNSISKFDLAISMLFPRLQDFVFSPTGGTIGLGTLDSDYCLPGNISLSRGLKVLILNEMLLIDTGMEGQLSSAQDDSHTGRYIPIPFFLIQKL